MRGVLAYVPSLKNPSEDRNLGNPDFQKKIAIGLADGVDEYFRS